MCGVSNMTHVCELWPKLIDDILMIWKIKRRIFGNLLRTCQYSALSAKCISRYSSYQLQCYNVDNLIQIKGGLSYFILHIFLVQLVHLDPLTAFCKLLPQYCHQFTFLKQHMYMTLGMRLLYNYCVYVMNRCTMKSDFFWQYLPKHNEFKIQTIIYNCQKFKDNYLNKNEFVIYQIGS